MPPRSKATRAPSPTEDAGTKKPRVRAPSPREQPKAKAKQGQASSPPEQPKAKASQGRASSPPAQAKAPGRAPSPPGRQPFVPRLSPPARRTSGKTTPAVEERPAERVAPKEEPAAEEPAVNIVKREVLVLPKASFPQAEAGAPAAQTEAPAVAPMPKAPPAGEMDRMRSALQRRANAGDQQQLAAYNACFSWADKRHFYWNSWIEGNPKREAQTAKKTFSSQMHDKNQYVDHGYCDRDFIAGKLQWPNWRTVPEQKIKLEHKLAQMESRLCAAAHLLSDEHDKMEYHFFEAISIKEEINSTSLELSNEKELEADDYQGVLQAVQNLSGASVQQQAPGRLSGGERNRQQRRPSPTERTEEPEWLKSFRKEATGAFVTAKKAGGSCLQSAEELMLLCKNNEAALAGNKLLQAYVETVGSHLHLLRQEDRTAADFELATQKNPTGETEANDLRPLWTTAANRLKSAKLAFTKATQTMQAALRDHLAKYKKSLAS